MSQLTRRRFVKQASKGVSAASLLAAVPGIAALSSSSRPTTAISQARLDTASLAESLVVHVRDLASGEISLMSGSKEIIFHDPELVLRLIKAAS